MTDYAVRRGWAMTPTTDACTGAVILRTILSDPERIALAASGRRRSMCDTADAVVRCRSTTLRADSSALALIQHTVVTTIPLVTPTATLLVPNRVRDTAVAVLRIWSTATPSAQHMTLPDIRIAIDTVPIRFALTFPVCRETRVRIAHEAVVGVWSLAWVVWVALEVTNPVVDIATGPAPVAITLADLLTRSSAVLPSGVLNTEHTVRLKRSMAAVTLCMAVSRVRCTPLAGPLMITLAKSVGIA
jgi:hypothetical protein